MTRHEIEAAYDVRNGIIYSPGKFQGEAVYAPAFYDAMLNGMADAEVGTEDRPIAEFHLTADDYAEWPELAGHAALALSVSNDGFVSVAIGPASVELPTSEAAPVTTLDLTPDAMGLLRFMRTLYAQGQQETARRLVLAAWRVRGADVDPLLADTLSLADALTAFEKGGR